MIGDAARQVGVLGGVQVDGHCQEDRRAAERIDDRQQRRDREQRRFDELAQIFGDHRVSGCRCDEGRRAPPRILALPRASGAAVVACAATLHDPPRHPRVHDRHAHAVRISRRHLAPAPACRSPSQSIYVDATRQDARMRDLAARGRRRPACAVHARRRRAARRRSPARAAPGRGRDRRCAAAARHARRRADATWPSRRCCSCSTASPIRTISAPACAAPTRSARRR